MKSRTRIWASRLTAATGLERAGQGSPHRPLPETERNLMNIKPEMKEKDLWRSSIRPWTATSIFYLETGKPTRDKIEVGFPMKGTGMVDQRLSHTYTEWGSMRTMVNLQFKYNIFSLIDQKPMYSIFGRDPAFRVVL